MAGIVVVLFFSNRLDRSAIVTLKNVLEKLLITTDSKNVELKVDMALEHDQ